MKNYLLILSLTITVLSCSKKTDPAPPANSTTTTSGTTTSTTTTSGTTTSGTTAGSTTGKDASLGTFTVNGVLNTPEYTTVNFGQSSGVDETDTHCVNDNYGIFITFIGTTLANGTYTIKAYEAPSLGSFGCKIYITDLKTSIVYESSAGSGQVKINNKNVTFSGIVIKESPRSKGNSTITVSGNLNYKI